MKILEEVYGVYFMGRSFTDIVSRKGLLRSEVYVTF